MRPAISVIFFTVSSGAGLGLLALLALVDLMQLGADLSRQTTLIAVVAGSALVTAGLVSSTFHLANPKNAWRALSQFRRSWLSREGVFAVALYVPLLAYAALIAGGAGRGAVTIAALALGALALATLYSTGMIYACLKTVPQWHTRLVPAAYVVLGLYSGALVLLALIGAGGGRAAPLGGLALLLLGAGVVIKGIYYAKFRGPAAGLTLAGALGFERQTRLLDVGHTHGNFLTHEFCFRIARERALALRAVSALLAFVVPLGILVFAAETPGRHAIAALACLAGLLVERWLFFAEAEHVVRLYHGQAAMRHPRPRGP